MKNHGRGQSGLDKNEAEMKKLVLGLALAALAACNTVSGVGQDISSGANHVAGWIGF